MSGGGLRLSSEFAVESPTANSTRSQAAQPEAPPASLRVNIPMRVQIADSDRYSPGATEPECRIPGTGTVPVRPQLRRPVTQADRRRAQRLRVRDSGRVSRRDTGLPGPPAGPEASDHDRTVTLALARCRRGSSFRLGVRVTEVASELPDSESSSCHDCRRSP